MSELTRPTLPTFSWIGHLKEDDRELLSSYGEFFPGHPGNVVIEEGKMQTEVFVVITGKLEVHAKQEDGTDILLAQVGPGETLGEISLFDPGPAAATVTAVEFSQLWRIADDDLMEFMKENPGAGNVLLRTLASILAQRLRQMNPKAFGLSTYAVVESPETPAALPTQADEPAVDEPAVVEPAVAEPTGAPAVVEPTPAPAPEPELPRATLLSSSGPTTAVPKKPLAPTTTEAGASYQDKSLPRKTQIVSNLDNLDELEPI
jgi:CRP/FNR family cyclic AMP-dependent transcriptional regulator